MFSGVWPGIPLLRVFVVVGDMTYSALPSALLDWQLLF